MYKKIKTKIMLALLAGVCAASEAHSAAELLGLLGRTLKPSCRLMSSVPHYRAPMFSLSEQVLAPKVGVRYFSSSSEAPNLLEDSQIKTALGKINGNCLKEIGARGTDDFVSKSHKVISLLKESLKRGSSIDGQGGLADAEADWAAAWERQSVGTQESLKNPHDAIESLISVANRHFYGIEPDLS